MANAKELLALILGVCHNSAIDGMIRANVTTTDSRSEVQLGAQGRVVIPAHLRKALDLKPGDRLVARQDGDSIVLERRENLLHRLRARYAHIPADISLADELMAERQAEAAREKDD